jgi:hypothetical protein
VSPWNLVLWLALVVAGMVAIPSAQARIALVTLPGRDSVQLTIYNSVDLTMVKETRLLTFRKGENKLEFSWANTLIDPTSVEFRALSHADQVEVLDVSFPPRVANTLEWRIGSEFAGEVKVEIRYFTSGINWAADYVSEAEKNEKAMNLAGYVRVNNNSGEDYENVQIRLVVGVVRLVEQIVNLAQPGSFRRQSAPVATSGLVANEELVRMRSLQKNLFGLAEAGEFAGQAQVVKEEMGEYFLYTVGGRDTIQNGWSKRLPSFSSGPVPITSYYKYERERWGDSVMRYYRFTNSEPSKLGKEPLPDGQVKAFRLATDDKLYAFVGRTEVKYIPVNETVDMEFGNDREVMVKPTMTNWAKVEVQFDNDGNVKGWTTKEAWQIELQNSKDIDVVVDLRRNFPDGDWSMDTKAEHENVDAHKVKFVVPLKPREKQTISYELTVRHGLNATK